MSLTTILVVHTLLVSAWAFVPGQHTSIASQFHTCVSSQSQWNKPTFLRSRFDSINEEGQDDDEEYYNDDEEYYNDDEEYYNDDEEYYDEDDYIYDEDDYFEEDEENNNRSQQNGDYYVDDLGEADEGKQDGGLQIPSPFGRRSGFRLPDSVSQAFLAGIFLMGVGMGITIDSAINTDPRDLASRDAIDQAAPNSNLCASYGASALALDQRVFVSFNPFNVYVAQADVKPACVLNPSNVVPVLQGRQLINDKEVKSCKNNMNTWAFVGELENMPQLSCVYKSEDAQNEFLSNPKLGIGEDVYDDDRELESVAKEVKAGLTKAQIDSLK